ncbi:hypothetical protein DSA95_18500 [Salmonella enterica subsp. enterica serovar Plymouth]|nr:hypothetical protein [Salmonella enterica subsp. enterica serovar Plymouth]EBX4512762.1 hypothetical protein [Salmonella enterica subsp. enterica serovar Plymouth]EBY2849455.1 hypothetical protein [Salmonella enterica subsp. enterica serovar Plymouth]EEE9141626.1 hypothetical protein [Salmonella enterica subsp. enterica serovar Plymouth]
MAGINTVVKRKQYLWLGIVVAGAVTVIAGGLYLSDAGMKEPGGTVAGQEPVPDMTGVVDTAFDDKVRQHATTEMQVTAAQLQKQYDEISRELDVLNKQRADDQRRIEKLGQDNAALAAQVNALGARPVTLTGGPVPTAPAFSPGPDGEPPPGNTPVSFPPQGTGTVPPPTTFYPGNGVTPPPQVTYQPVPVPDRILRKVFPLPRSKDQSPSLPYIPSGSFAKAMLVEGADANASVTGNESTVPAFDRNGKSAGIWLNPLTTDDGAGLRGFNGEGRVKGSEDAQFVALQGSRNGESLLAADMQEGVRIARDNPDSGVVVRIAGEGRPWNPGAITGGRVWGDIPDNSVQPGTGNGEPVTAAILAQRQAEEAIRRETERRADEIVRKMAEDKPALSDGKTEQAVREIAGQERERAATSERESALPESVLREPQREREAVRVVARENLLQERLQQMARDRVRDLQKEKTPGGD